MIKSERGTQTIEVVSTGFGVKVIVKARAEKSTIHIFQECLSELIEELKKHEQALSKSNSNPQA